MAGDLETLLMLGAHDIVWLNGPWGGVLEDPFASQWANLFPEYPYEEDDEEDDDEEEDEREESEDGGGDGGGDGEGSPEGGGDGDGAGEAGGGEAGGEPGAEAPGEAGADPQPSSPESSGGGPEPYDPDYLPPSTPDEWGERNDVPGSAIPINTADPPDGLQGPDGSDGLGEDWWSNQPEPMQGGDGPWNKPGPGLPEEFIQMDLVLWGKGAAKVGVKLVSAGAESARAAASGLSSRAWAAVKGMAKEGYSEAKRLFLGLAGQRTTTQMPINADKQPPGNAQGKAFNTDQAVLVELAKRAQHTGVTREEAQTLQNWARELGIPTRGPESHTRGGFGQNVHIHIGPVNHIPIRQ